MRHDMTTTEDTTPLDTLIEKLQHGEKAWAAMPLRDRIILLDALTEAVHQHAQE